MGGNAFRNHRLERLTRIEYIQVKSRAEATLQCHFAGVCTPVADPDQTTYGDVDFLVHTPLNRAHDDAALATALQATEFIKGEPTSSFLVVIDTEMPNRCAQIDVHRCEDEESWGMLNFMHSYGRLGLILGRSVATSGLWLGEKGLFSKKPRRDHPAFLLTCQVTEVMRACHLVRETYEAGLHSRRALFDWLAAGRLGDKQLADLWQTHSRDEQDSMLSAWRAYCSRRSDFRMTGQTIDVRMSLVVFFGLQSSYTAWQAGQEDIAAAKQVDRARRKAVSAEVRRQLECRPESGPARGALSRQIRAELDDRVSDDTSTDNLKDISQIRSLGIDCIKK